MAITYTNKGSATTTAISKAPKEVKDFWNLCDKESVSIARVRKLKDRYEHSSGKTFETTHFGKVSLNVARKYVNRDDKIRFNRTLGIGKRNPIMQVLEVPENFKVESKYLDAFKALRMANNGWSSPSLLQRLKDLF
tara:strand:- start:141 stop:548 length:408 start_codon:yes stop_codon:yes gene_type:complete